MSLSIIALSVVVAVLGVGCLAAIAVIIPAHIRTLKGGSMTHPAGFSEELKAFGDQIRLLKQALEDNEKVAKVLKTALDVGSPSAIADARKLADAIISNSQNARG